MIEFIAGFTIGYLVSLVITEFTERFSRHQEPTKDTRRNQ